MKSSWLRGVTTLHVDRYRPASSVACHPPRGLHPAAARTGAARHLPAAVAAALLLGGCAVNPNLNTLQGASLHQPTNAEARIDYLRARNLQVDALLDEAERLRASLQFDDAMRRLQEASRLDPTSERGRKIGAQLALDRRDFETLQEADRMLQRGSVDAAAARVRRVLAENPTNAQALQLLRRVDDKLNERRVARDEKLAASSIARKPVSLQFRDANVRMVFEALSRTSGLNVIFDRDVRADLKTTIFVNNATLQDTVDMILMQNQLDKKVLNGNTLFIYPATPAKQLEYQELKVRTFQLSNVEAKQIQALLKSLLKLKEVVIDEHANTVSIRGTPDTIRVAEQMIAAHDLPEPEVMLEVQVLEVSHDRMTDLGIAWPNSFTVATPGTANTWGALHKLTGNALEVSGLSATANFKLTDTDANLLASPRIRTRNKEKARILIGDKVPVISSSSTPSTSGPSYAQMIQYLDVGIKLEVEPQVYRDGDVGIKLNLEVSNITKTISSSNAQTGLSSLAYQIGTRSASTSLRLRDGESQILGGLISDQDRASADKVPGLGQLPVLGRLFSDHNGDHVKSEIVLQITPHIIRPQLVADADTQEVWSGTDTNVHAEQLRLDPAGSGDETPAAAAAPLLPGNVGGGATGHETAGAAARGAGRTAQAPSTGSLGQPAAAPRTSAPPAPYGGRFSTLPAVPPTAGAAAGSGGSGGSGGSAGSAGAAAAGGAAAAATTQAGGEAARGNAAPGPGATVIVVPAQAPGAAAAPPVVVQMVDPTAGQAPPAPAGVILRPNDMPTENPLHGVPTGGY